MFLSVPASKKGKGLQLLPKRLGRVDDDGLFFKHGSQIYEGKGLLFGPNSPFKNIPILNFIL